MGGKLEIIMNQRSRAWRRLENSRVENKAFKKFKFHSFSYDSMETKNEENKRLKERTKYSKNNMTNCSCYMCGNPSYPKLKNLSKQTDNHEIKEFFNNINNK